jgi:hypothetical protein
MGQFDEQRRWAELLAAPPPGQYAGDLLGRAGRPGAGGQLFVDLGRCSANGSRLRSLLGAGRASY